MRALVCLLRNAGNDLVGSRSGGALSDSVRLLSASNARRRWSGNVACVVAPRTPTNRPSDAELPKPKIAAIATLAMLVLHGY